MYSDLSSIAGRADLSLFLTSGNPNDVHETLSFPDTKKPTIFLFCYRFFDLRNLVSTGVVQRLARFSKLVLFVEPRIVEFMRDHFDGEVQVEPLAQAPLKTGLLGALARSAKGLCTNVLQFSYAEEQGRPNLTGMLHRSSYLKRRRNSLGQRAAARITVALAVAASRRRWLRELLQRTYRSCSQIDLHGTYYHRHRPSLVAVCSFGLDADGLVIAEASQRGVPSCTIVQSWDKTSSKGYPVAHPDMAILWSSVTADEATDFLDMNRDRLFVEGAPLWDDHFTREQVIPRDDFLTRQGLALDRHLIFVALAPQAFHEGNMSVVRHLIETQNREGFAEPTQLLFRFHPGYLTNPDLYRELLDHCGRYEKEKHVVFSKPAAMRQNDAWSLLEEDDFAVLSSCFAHCSAAVSILSSHLIESAIYDKPMISVEFGRWLTQWYDIDIRDYRAEHLDRVFAQGSAYRATSAEQLIAGIDEALASPELRREQRRRLVAQEATTNRGTAVRNTVERLLSLARRSSARTLETSQEKV